MKKIAKTHTEVCRLLGYQGIFECLAEIMKTEDRIIVKDCIDLMKTLMTDSNKEYIREIPSFYNAVLMLIQSEHREYVSDLLLIVCTENNGNVHSKNQKFFSKIIPGLLAAAYPDTGDQPLVCLNLVKIMLENNPAELNELLDADFIDVLDRILSYCAIGTNYEKNIENLWLVISNRKQISEILISRITCSPTFIEKQGVLPIFNYVLNRVLVEKHSIHHICNTFETILYGNEASKQLAVHLPIDMNSGTLLSRIFDSWVDSLSPENENSIYISKLFVVWTYDSVETALKLVSSICNSLPSILTYLEKTGIGQSLTSILLGLVCLYSKSNEIENILIKKIGFIEFCEKLEYLNGLPEFKKNSDKKIVDFKNLLHTPPLIKTYKLAVQVVKMHFLKGLTETVPDNQKDLAKLLEAQEAVIYQFNKHYSKQGQVNEDTAELHQKMQELELELKSKTNEIQELKLNLSETQYENNKKLREVVSSVVSLYERLDLSDFENMSLKRENLNLKAKIERLTEEIKTYTTKKTEIRANLKIIEIKENLLIQTNEVNYLRKLLEKKTKEHEEALAIIGKQESQLKAVGVSEEIFIE